LWCEGGKEGEEEGRRTFLNFDYFIGGLDDAREETGAPLIMIYDRTKKAKFSLYRDLN
jgi:hypothetical protein